jgi:hypothetical protein
MAVIHSVDMIYSDNTQPLSIRYQEKPIMADPKHKHDKDAENLDDGKKDSSHKGLNPIPETAVAKIWSYN